MSFTITCPDCRATLKANKAPRADKLIQCLKCSHRFTLADSTSITADPPPAVIFPPARSISMPRVLLTVVALMVLAVAGFFGANYASRPDRASETPKSAEIANVEKKDPLPEPKPEAKPEPKAEPKEDIELERRREKFTYLMIDAGIATQLRKHDEAVSAYTEALRIFPDDTEVHRKLGDARAAFEAHDKTRRELEQVQSDTAALVKRGQAALDKDQFPAAIDFFKLALAKSPTNEEAAEKLLAAQNRLQKANADKKKLDDFDQHVLSGKAALKAGRSADAVREFVAAGRILPNDPLPPELLKDAELQLAKNNNNQGDRKKQHQSLLDQAAGFLRDKKIEDADDAYRQALRLFPDDPIAKRGLDDIQKNLKQARAEVANFINQAQNAIAQGQIPAAALYLREADKIMPRNPDLIRAWRAVELIQANQPLYFQAINRAAIAMSLHRFGDALIAYSDALFIVPNDTQATLGVLAAQRGLETLNRRKREYDILVNQGVLLLKSQRYVEAARSLEAAVRLNRPPLLPDPPVQALSRFADAMVQGITALNNRQFILAAQLFQTALNELPNDPAAQSGLQKALAGAKGRPG